MEAKNWTRIVNDKKTGKNILVFNTLVNGIYVAPEDLGDPDAMSENFEIDNDF